MSKGTVRYVSCRFCHKESTVMRIMSDQHLRGCFGRNIHESDRIYGIYEYWNHKRHSIKNMGFELTGDEMVSLFDEAGIHPNQLGRKPHLYQLGRYGDTGPYKIGNCRFITQGENLSERKERTTFFPLKNTSFQGKTLELPKKLCRKIVINGIWYASHNNAKKSIGIETINHMIDKMKEASTYSAIFVTRYHGKIRIDIP